MNEIENIVTDELKVWETFSRDQIEQIIQGNIRSVDEKMGQMMELFITSGYYLRRQYNEKMYLDAGYDRFEDYVKDRYGKSRSWATRMMQINEQYSISGNDPRIDPKYKLYGVSQLQEMLYLTDEQREQASPDMTVKEIRALKTPAPVEEEPIPGQMNVEDFPEVMPEHADQEETEDTDELLCDTCMNASSLTGNPDLCQNCTSEGNNYKARCITGKSGSGLCGAAAYCNEPVSCCAACEDKCNSQCGWLEEKDVPEPEIDFKALDKMIEVATSQKEECCESVVDMDPLTADSITAGAIVLPDQVIDAEYTEVTEETTITPQSLLAEAKKWLEDYIKCDAPKNLIEKQKIYVGALANMVCELEGMTKPDTIEQPELPVMKNNDQRKDFIDAYTTWPIWIDIKETGERYYRYEFPEQGTAIVVKVYYHSIYD